MLNKCSILSCGPGDVLNGILSVNWGLRIRIYDKLAIPVRGLVWLQIKEPTETIFTEAIKC